MLEAIIPAEGKSNFTYWTWRVTGDLGGSMGLLIGASVTTLFEAVDAFVIALTSWRRRKKRQQRRSLKKETENEL